MPGQCSAALGISRNRFLLSPIFPYPFVARLKFPKGSTVLCTLDVIFLALLEWEQAKMLV